MPDPFWLLAGMVAVAGLGAGVLSGLLGVGGGIVIVPALDYAFSIAGVADEVRMHLAVGTSLASIVPTAWASASAHRRRGAVDDQIGARWAPPIVAGAAGGALLASAVRGSVLAGLFGAVALLMAWRMLRNSDAPSAVWGRWAGMGRGRVVPAAIGLVSAMMGIGGGTFTVPALTGLGTPVHRSVGTAAWLGLWIAIPAAAGYLVLGLGRTGLPPWSVGFVNVLALAALLPCTVLMAPVGARIAHGLSQRGLSVAFSLFLALVGVRMLYRALTG